MTDAQLGPSLAMDADQAAELALEVRRNATSQHASHEVRLLCALRLAMGDNGQRLNSDLVTYAAELRRKADGFDRDAARRLAERESAIEAIELCARMSVTQTECLKLACKGYTAKEIAAMHGTSYWTASRHFDEIRKRLQVNSMTMAAVMAVKAGLV